MTGALFTGGTISGGSLNINGNAIINTSGFLTATGATILELSHLLMPQLQAVALQLVQTFK
jgi:hypothetical protein